MNRIPHRALGVLALAVAPMAVPVQASATGSIVLTNADSARSVEAVAGHDIEVRLTSYRENGLTYTWQLPETSDSAKLPRTSDNVNPAGHAAAVFHADGPGDSVITVHRTCRPDPDRNCPAVMHPWKAAVRVK
ncbi:hypothetical protein AB0H76_34805 [Nocardia sp. NPDC050712]|uniref:hypothetical protein n=1 Tax=Nocardia sp. NPDC050712 TaxID=3155518 RepID=UPI0033BFDF2B